MPGPSNLYGVATPVGVTAFTYLTGDILTVAGVESNVLTATLIAPSSGYFYPVMFGMVTITNGATPPTSMIVAGKIGAGSDFNNVGVPVVLNTANANYILPFTLAGPASNVVWQGAGAVLTCGVTSGGQAVTVRGASTYMQAFLFRAPDQ